ncbi:LysR family transcriptional regulator [Fructobacillus sp. M1-13]|uniref:LysR family transcriptional regulator n=1 Tax=Fructobacillus papyriferae TaxID=2713171 RepID=A0ABS5QQR4_9LACO|nr:LysR family transcriptional regulator [Fructobacillus papyriferae]MBS9335456.1 LysR family transcriptional regulator [Fructobacillus papyriferae]MCD2159226.1 LysR family transcriptional regulator [Fructobacillus papyriferae]
MRIQDLAYYMALADLGSFSQVSKKFKISQPTVSLAIKRLEKELKTELIWRDPSRQQLTLTHSGRILQKHAAVILQEMALAETEIIKEANQKFVLGLTDLVEFAYFPAVKEHLSDHFLIHLQKRLVHSDEALSQIQKGDLDAAFITGDLSEDSNLIEEKLTILDIPHPALHLYNEKNLPPFRLSFVYLKDRLDDSDLSAILTELQHAIWRSSKEDFTLIKKTEDDPKV